MCQTSCLQGIQTTTAVLFPVNIKQHITEPFLAKLFISTRDEDLKDLKYSPKTLCIEESFTITIQVNESIKYKTSYVCKYIYTYILILKYISIYLYIYLDGYFLKKEKLAKYVLQPYANN